MIRRSVATSTSLSEVGPYSSSARGARLRDHDGDPGDQDGDPGDHDADPGDHDADLRDHDAAIRAITMERNAHLAEKVKPQPGETATIWIERAVAWANANRSHPHADAVLERARQPEFRFFTLAWTMAWGANACPRLIVPHKLGASLMATSCGKDPIATRCAPWSAYMIEIPPELVRIEVDGKLTAFDVIGVWRDFEGKSYINVYSRTSEAAFGGELAFPVADFAETEDAWDVDTTAIKRATECLQRLVLCVELEMSEPSNVKAPRTPSGKKRKDGEAPPANVHRLVRQVLVDCREAIADYIAGTRRNAPKVSWLTIGHYRWVAYGPRWSRTRWQHIEPFWNNRGAEVAVRPHRLRDDD